MTLTLSLALSAPEGTEKGPTLKLPAGSGHHEAQGSVGQGARDQRGHGARG